MSDVIVPRRNALTRLPDWQPRLIRYVQSKNRKPFEVGEHDCATFWIGAVEAMTGHRPVQVTWRNTADCLAMLRANGDSLERAFQINEALGPAAVADRSTLSRGDVVLYHQPNQGDTFGLVWDKEFLLGPGAEYMERESTIVAQKVWRV